MEATPRGSGRSRSAPRSRASAPRRPRRRGARADGGGRGAGAAGSRGRPSTRPRASRAPSWPRRTCVELRGVSRNDVACTPAAPPTLLAIACVMPALAALGGAASWAPRAALAEGLLLAAAPVTVALLIAAAAGNAVEETPWWAADALPRVSARTKRLAMTAMLVAAEMRLFPASLSVSGLPAAAAAAAAAATRAGGAFENRRGRGRGPPRRRPRNRLARARRRQSTTNKELAAAWPAVAAGGAALFLSNKAGPLAAFMALAPLPWALARPEARITEDAFVASKSTRRAAAVAVGAHAVGACWARYQASRRGR